MHVAAGQTDASIAHDLALAERTVWLSRHRFAERRLDGLKVRPKKEFCVIHGHRTTGLTWVRATLKHEYDSGKAE
jgi:hypothetical protein